VICTGLGLDTSAGAFWSAAATPVILVGMLGGIDGAGADCATGTVVVGFPCGWATVVKIGDLLLVVGHSLHFLQLN